MKYGVLFAVLFMFAVSVKAGMVARDEGGNVITLMTEQCTAGPWMKDWKTASFLYRGQLFKACWRIQGTTVILLDSGGDVTPVPMGAFSQETTI